MRHNVPPLMRSALLAFPLLLAGCDLQIPGISPSPQVVAREAEAKAIGSACRHAMRGLEDCYTLNPRAPKAQVYAGWKEMDQYMRDNKLEGVPSVLTQQQRPPATKDADIETELKPAAAPTRNRS